MELRPLKYLMVAVFFVFTATLVFLPLSLSDKIRHVRDPRRRICVNRVFVLLMGIYLAKEKTPHIVLTPAISPCSVVSSLKHAYQTVVSLTSCFGGGVFLATCLLHLLPEARSQFSKGIVNHWENAPDFPFVEFLCIGGLLLVLVIEQVTLFWKETHAARLTYSAPSPFGRDTPVVNYGSLQQSDSHGDGHVRGVADDIEDAEEEEGNMESIHGDPNSHSSLRSIVLVMSLSLHSIFEGIAIGLQPNVQLLLQILAAVSIHKSILAVTLGLNLVHSRLGHCSIVTSALAFSLMAPLGMVLAILLMQGDSGEAALLNGILQGLACGTFLYVTFFEVLPHEMSHTHNRLPKVLCMVVGVGAITMLLLSLPH